MEFNKAYKFRIYPTKSQIEYIEGCFSACRYVYNISLDCEKQLYQLGAESSLSTIGLSYHLKSYKISDPWLEKYDSLALGFEMENLAKSFEKFFKGGGYPKFKSKKERRQSFRTRQSVSLLENAIKIPKLKTPIECVVHRKIEGKIQQFTISRENDKYYVSIMTKIKKEFAPVEIKKEVGIDLGVKHFLTRDDGVKVENPKFLSEKAAHLAKLQQALSKAKKGSNNYNKLRKKIANLYEKISNKRKDFLHNESAKLVNEFDRIYMEDLNVSGMTRSSKGTIEKPGKKVKQKSGLNRNILDVGLGNFKSIIEYKTKFNNKEIVKVNRFFASSKICHKCGTKNNDLKLSDRIWVCSSCGELLDRDENAAKNIKAEGRRSLTLIKE